jgi:hypothetical protein
MREPGNAIPLPVLPEGAAEAWGEAMAGVSQMMGKIPVPAGGFRLVLYVVGEDGVRRPMADGVVR